MRIAMQHFRVEALEKFVVRTIYTVQADSRQQVEALCRRGKVAYERSSIEEGDEEWL